MKKKWRQLTAALAAALTLSACSFPAVGSAPAAESSISRDQGPGALAKILSGLREGESSASAEEPEEMRAVWIAYLDLAPLLRGKTEAEFSEGFSAMAENCRTAGFNTVIVQVRPFGDSFYPSAYFPWSNLVGGALSYDPMEIMTAEAAENGLSFHAWINPMRAMTEAEAAAVPQEFLLRQWYDDPVFRTEHLILLDGRIYLNPASAEARKLIADGAAELAANYAIDGVHIDDYFYPPSLDLSIDAASYESYCGAGGTLDQADWRRENTFQMVRELSAAVKKANPSAQFGVSPRGKMSQNTDDLFIDLERWAKEPECLDYLAPQLYYGFRNTAAPFADTAEEWNRLAEDSGVRLIIGLAAYKIGSLDSYAGEGASEWMEDPDLLANQIAESRKLSAYGGVMLFRYGSIFQPDAEHQSSMEKALESFLPLLSEKADPAG